MDTMPIDVWNTETFDDALLAELNSERDLLRDYALTDKRQFLERQAATGWVPHATNPYAAARNYFVEHVVMPAMEQRTIRAWDYTRLTDDETALLELRGTYISDLAAIRRRLDAQVAARVLSAGTADALYAASPFHHQNDSRAGRFWMTSHPVSAENSLVGTIAVALGRRRGVLLASKTPSWSEPVKKLWSAACDRTRGCHCRSHLTPTRRLRLSPPPSYGHLVARPIGRRSTFTR